jgi:hypothetical protein
MNKPSRFSTQIITIAAVAILLGCFCLFVLWTFPWSHNDAPSKITVEWLPRSEWGFGYWCFDSNLSPAAGRSYGPILVKRQYDFRKYYLKR